MDIWLYLEGFLKILIFGEMAVLEILNFGHFQPKIEDFRILLIWSVPKLGRTGALGKPKMGHVIGKISVYKLYAAI